ncbi:spindle and kinetochore-associated protein 1 [Protopterus annectens]|uniref:spindle and kinetochore-associated protein 1 n=1 Tax=Protopterus annectens TaxID=7888 RepID=UPI001CFAEABE|nr:spindle and kinetochore-associated protein 1 [Protopterus annectens]
MATSIESLHLHVNNKIATIKKSLQLRNIASDPDMNTILKKIGLELAALNDVLNRFEAEVEQQENSLNFLKDLKASLDGDMKAVLHLSQNIPPHLPRKAAATASEMNGKPEENTKDAETHDVSRKQSKCSASIKEMVYITVQEFETVPPYMKGRLTYDQVNATVRDINKAVFGKYKILRQPIKSLNNVNRNLYHRFMEEETKETKGLFFVVDADIKEFCQKTVDKRFQGMLSILRHCQRIREVRGGKVVRYVLL